MRISKNRRMANPTCDTLILTCLTKSCCIIPRSTVPKKKFIIVQCIWYTKLPPFRTKNTILKHSISLGIMSYHPHHIVRVLWGSMREGTEWSQETEVSPSTVHWTVSRSGWNRYCTIPHYAVPQDHIMMETWILLGQQTGIESEIGMIGKRHLR